MNDLVIEAMQNRVSAVAGGAPGFVGSVVPYAAVKSTVGFSFSSNCTAATETATIFLQALNSSM